MKLAHDKDAQQALEELRQSIDDHQEALGQRLRQASNINPPTDCNTCHR